MAVLARDDFMAKLKVLIGDRTDDEAIGIMEDFTDTYDRTGDTSEYEQRISELEEEKTRIDNEWRSKYTARFWDGKKDNTVEPEPDTSGDTDVVSQQETVYVDPEKVTFEDLFTEKGE